MLMVENMFVCVFHRAFIYKLKQVYEDTGTVVKDIEREYLVQIMSKNTTVFK